MCTQSMYTACRLKRCFEVGMKVQLLRTFDEQNCPEKP